MTEDYSSYESVDEEEPEAPKAKAKATKKKPVTVKKSDSDEESQEKEKPAGAKPKVKSGIKPSASGRALDPTKSKGKASAAKVGGQGSIMGFFGPQPGKKK